MAKEIKMRVECWIPNKEASTKNPEFNTVKWDETFYGNEITDDMLHVYANIKCNAPMPGKKADSEGFTHRHYIYIAEKYAILHVERKGCIFATVKISW